MPKINHVYDNISVDARLNKGERTIFKFLVGISKYASRDVVMAVSEIARRNSYSDMQINRIKKSLISKGYVVVISQGGKTGNDCAVLRVNFPSDYVFPIKKEATKEEKLAMAKRILVKEAWCSSKSIDEVIHQGLTSQDRRARRGGLKSVVSQEKLKNRYSSETRAAAGLH